MVLRQTESAPASMATPGARVLILEAPYYAHITNPLAEGAMAVISAAGGAATRIVVPGALELPQALAAYVHADRIGRFAGPAKAYDGAVVLGCVIRGETTHYDTVCDEANRGVMDVALRHGVPVGNAILTVENEAQAKARADGGKANKGGDAARACLALIALQRQLEPVS
jgi:6,7-dimethyl-8-ribityllumazine synthase